MLTFLELHEVRPPQPQPRRPRHSTPAL
jgi:hypothetical protein